MEIVDEGAIFRDVEEHEDHAFTEIPGTDTLYPADSVIISITQGPQNAIVSTTTDLSANSRGLLVTNESGQTTRPGIFASGDVVNGARTVVEAVAYSKKVAQAMHAYIQSTWRRRAVRAFCHPTGDICAHPAQNLPEMA